MKKLILLIVPLLFFGMSFNLAHAKSDSVSDSGIESAGESDAAEGITEGNQTESQASVGTKGRGDTDGIVPCSGLDCDACSLVKLIERIIDWLIEVMLVIFAIITAVAGFRLVMSGGNPQVKTDAKNLLTNAFIGIVIVLTAWLLINTLMRAILPSGTGELEGYGPWSSVQCNKQVGPGERVQSGDVNGLPARETSETETVCTEFDARGRCTKEVSEPIETITTTERVCVKQTPRGCRGWEDQEIEVRRYCSTRDSSGSCTRYVRVE
jgi:hypothetical protein